MAAVVGVAALALANALAVPLLLEALVAAHPRTPPLLAAAAAGRFDADVPWSSAVGAPAALAPVVAAYEARSCADPARLQRCALIVLPRGLWHGCRPAACGPLAAAYGGLFGHERLVHA